MPNVATITPAEAKKELGDKDTLLVCAYDDEEKCRKLRVDGSIPLAELKRREPSPDQSIIFYCN